MDFTAQDFSSSTQTGSVTAVGTKPDNGEFLPKLHQALENMDTQLMHEIVTRECAGIFSKKLDDFVSFLRRLSSGNRAIFLALIKEPMVLEKLKTLQSEVDHFTREAA